MINNAGMPQTNQPMLDVDEDTFQRIFDVNVKSIFLAARAVVPVMREQGSGSIINTASTAALRPRPGLVWYNASKGAVTTMTKAMAVELAPDQIRVNALCPVAGETPMLGAFLGGEVTNEMRSAFVSTVPMGRLSTPRDMANAALVLSHPMTARSSPAYAWKSTAGAVSRSPLHMTTTAAYQPQIRPPPGADRARVLRQPA